MIMVTSILTKYLKVNFLLKYFLIPLALLALYCGSFGYFSSRSLPESVNPVFVSRLLDYALVLLAVVSLLTLGLLASKRADHAAFNDSAQKIAASDFLLLLLPLTPVVQYIIRNQNSLSVPDSLFVLVFFVLFSGLYIYAIPALLGRYSSTQLLMSLGLAFAFTITSMALLSQNFSWFESGSMKIQLPFFAGVFIACWFVLSLKSKRVFLYLIALNFLVNSGIQFFSQAGQGDEASLPVAENKIQSIVGDRVPAVTPNIYLLIYDSYVANETMLAYGIDNRAQEDFLSEQGFVLYPHTYSVGSETIESMSRVLNATTEDYKHRRSALAGDGIVQNTLSSLGYLTYGIFPYDYMFRGVGSSYDFSIPEYKTSPYVHLISAILMGEFRFDIGFEVQTIDQYVETKHSILAGLPAGPVFVYAHSTLPGHSQNSGTCLPDEIELYNERLTSANLEMRQDIATILENDPHAIIIVAGDHGPYLTKNCTSTDKVYDISEISRLDIQDRFGSFLAIRWPSEEYAEYDDITVLQDIFPAIFAYLYSDASFLESGNEPVIQNSKPISGATVKNGIISGGINDGEPLFLSDK